MHPLCMSIQPRELEPCSQPPQQQSGAASCAHASHSCDWEGLEIITGIVWAALTCTWRHTGAKATTNALGNALCSHCPANSERATCQSQLSCTASYKVKLLLRNYFPGPNSTHGAEEILAAHPHAQF